MIYFIQHGDSGPIKIGFTKDDPNRRLGILQVGNPEKLMCIKVIEGNIRDEHDLHHKFRQHFIRGEWFQPAEELVSFVNSQEEYTEHSGLTPLSMTAGKQRVGGKRTYKTDLMFKCASAV
jgi:hypothetical protein